MQKILPLQKRNRWVKPALISVVLAYMGATVILPVACLFADTLSHGWRAFLAVLLMPDVWAALRLTLLLSAGALFLNTVLGLATAWVLVRHRFPGKGLWNALVDLPFAVSPVVAGYMYLLLFGRKGWLYPWVEPMGFPVVFSWPGMLLATTFVSLPFVIREVMPVLKEMGTGEEEAARTLGAGSWQTFLRVVLPSIRWGLLYGMTLTFARALGEFGAVLVVGGGVIGETETATLFVFRAMEERMEQAAYSVSVLLAGTSFLVIAALEVLKKQLREY
jgi:sulfate transport system permease protein